MIYFLTPKTKMFQLCLSRKKEKPLQTFDLQWFIFLFSYPDPVQAIEIIGK